MLFSWHFREDVIVSLVRIMGIVWVLIGLSSRTRWLWWNLIMILIFNQALLGKLLLCLVVERVALWRRVVETECGITWGGWCVESVRGPYGVSLWKFISQGWVKFEYFIYF